MITASSNVLGLREDAELGITSLEFVLAIDFC